MNNTKVNECLLVSVEFTQDEDAGVLIVVRQKNGKVDIVNAFQGQEAIDIYEKLITVNKKEVNQ